MIQQPIQRPTQQPICDSASQCSGNGIERSWLGHGVAVCKAFAKSLIPPEDPCLSFNSRKAVEDLVRLATVTILPPSSILFIVKDMANAWSGSGLPGPDAKPELPQTSKETREEAQEKEPGSKDVPLQQPSTARYQGSQGTKGLLALGTLASSFQYGNSKLINITNAEDLGKIGRDREYQLHDTYQQTADIVVNKDYQSIGNDTHPFTGQYDGQCRTISGLSDCFVDILQGNISNLHFTGANITSQKTTGLAACVVERGGMVANIMAVDSTVETVGADAGIGGGRVKGKVANTTAVNSRVTTSGDDAQAGIGGGWVEGTVDNTTAVYSHVTTSGDHSDAGIGGGVVEIGGTVANTTAVYSHATTSGYGSDAGIGGGAVRGTVANTTAVNSRVETSCKYAEAGIGGGEVYGTVANTTAVNSHVTTKGECAYAGTGGGWVKGTVANTTAVNSRVETSGKYADAGIGGGWVYGTVANTTAVNSHVITSGDDADAGIGDGAVGSGGTVANTTAVNSFVNGSKKNFGSISYDQLLCQADQSVSTAAKEPTAAAAAATVSADVTASTAATVGGITTGSLLAGGLGLGIAGYSTHQWITGYREGLRGKKLAMKPLTRGKELASAAVNSVSQGIQGIRERMSRQSVSTQEPFHEMSQVQDWQSDEKPAPGLET